MLERRLDELSDAVRPQVGHPDFEALHRRASRRRRQHSVGAVAAAVVIAAAVVVVVDQIAGQPDPSPRIVDDPPPERDALTAEEIVKHPEQLTGFAVSTSDPDVRAARWLACQDRSCIRTPEALAVTDDGFDTASYVKLPADAWDQAAIDADTFAVTTSDSVLLIDTDGSTRRLPLDRDGPLSNGEVLVASGSGAVAIDPVGEAAHPIPLPEGKAATAILEQAPDGRIWGRIYRGSVMYAVWSNDGGATWDERPISTVSETGISIPSFAPGVLACIEARNPVTMLRTGTIHRSIDGGESWQTLPAPGFGDTGPASGWQAVRPDGSLWVTPVSRPRESDPGPYVTPGTDWSQLDPVEPGYPDEVDIAGNTDFQYAGLDAEGDLVLYVSDRDQDLYVSTDGGDTWERTASR
ncbi:MAG TPA: sialidase family protein [Nocardioidaceae bacterium]|nr:sialidase family protein [Nocardioidaceae bacterium]